MRRFRTRGQRGGGQANRDPLGRKQGDRLDDGDSVKVPNEITVQRARAILDELRKRLGQPTRPPVELDYLDLVKPYYPGSLVPALGWLDI